VTTPPAKRKPIRDAARLVILGISLGVAAFILHVLITSQIATVLHERVEAPSVWTWMFARLLYDQIGVLLVAPVLAYACGLLVEGPRRVLATGIVLSFQGVRVVMGAAIFGLSTLLDLEDILLLVVFTAVGVALCIWTMGRGQRRAHRHDAQKPGAPTEPKLAAIDFAAVKQQQATADAPAPAPAPEPKPADPVAPPAAPAGTEPPKPQG
jgi:hypothetical protein